MEVHHHHVGTLLTHALQRVLGVRGGTDQSHVLALQEGGCRGEERLVVVDDHHAQGHVSMVAGGAVGRMAGSTHLRSHGPYSGRMRKEGSLLSLRLRKSRE